MRWQSWLVLAVAAAFAAGRFIVPTNGLHAEDIFKDGAHVFVGGVGGAWLVGRRRLLLWVFIGLCAVEVVAVVVRR